MPSKKHQSAIESNNAFMVKMEDLVKEIIIQNNIPYYRIESRMDHQHTESGENIYMPIVRVITYFEDSVSKISEIICSEFEVINERSTDKKKVRLDSFSYKHIQYVAALKPARQELIEYRRSGDKQFEVQVCSMLQDAWAGIEKELGYDNATFPEEMKRDFYRVGALLEMADLEFLKIRSQLSSQMGLLDQNEETEDQIESVEEVAMRKLQEAELNDTEEEDESIDDENEEVTEEQPLQQPYFGQYGMPPEYMNGYPMNGMPMHPYYQQQYMNGANGMPNGFMPPQPIFNNGVFQGYMPMQNGYLPGQPFMPGQPMPGQPFYPQQPGQPTAPQTPQSEQKAPGTKQPKSEPKKSNAAKKPVVETSEAKATEIAEAKAFEIPEVKAEVKETQIPVAKIEEVAVEPQVEAQREPIAEEQAAPVNGAKVQPEVNGVANGQTNGISLETIDMNVSKPNSLALNINTVDQVNGVENGLMPEMVNGSPSAMPLTATEKGIEPVATSNTPSENVALNIDKVETFNMNVNGVIETRTEIIIDKNAKDESIPFYDRDPIPVKSNVLDENAPMTDSMLKEYVNNSKLVKDVDAEVARRSGASLNAEVDVEGDVERLKFLKVYTLKQLHERIQDNKNDIIAFAEKWIGSDNGGSFDSGICLFYLEYLLVGKRNDPAFAVEYVLKFISDNDYSARFIIPTYNSISKSDKPIGAHLTLK